jgi:hypothetical protein
MNNELLQKFVEIARDASREMGKPFLLFALLTPKMSPSKWDVVVSADLGTPTYRPLIDAVASQIQKRLTDDELWDVSRVVPVDSKTTFVRSMLNRHKVEYEITPVEEVDDKGILVGGYLIVAGSNVSNENVARGSQMRSDTAPASHMPIGT